MLAGCSEFPVPSILRHTSHTLTNFWLFLFREKQSVFAVIAHEQQKKEFRHGAGRRIGNAGQAL